MPTTSVVGRSLLRAGGGEKGHLFAMTRLVMAVLIVTLLAGPPIAHAQDARVQRVGAVLYGGPYWAAIDGLRDGLKELGLEDGKQVIFDIRDVKGDLKAVEMAAKSLEDRKIDVIYSVTTSVTIAVKRATRTVPVVFYAGTDPVEAGLVESFRKPGGRITGVYSRSTPLVAKRLELLKELIPSLRKVVTFYNPDNPVSRNSADLARDAARALRVELLERPVRSVEELRGRLDALRPGEADALSYVDGMVVSQEEAILDAAIKKRLPTIVANQASVAKGALAGYGVNYYVNGRLSARHVQRVLAGARPADVPIEHADRFHLAINLKTASALGLTIPQSVLARADELIK